MRAWFGVRSQIHSAEVILSAIRRIPSRVDRIGEKPNPASKKTWSGNLVLVPVYEGLEFSGLGVEIHNLIPDVDFSLIKESYKYIDIELERGSYIGDMLFRHLTIEALRAHDIQIEIDITRY